MAESINDNVKIFTNNYREYNQFCQYMRNIWRKGLMSLLKCYIILGILGGY